MRYLHAACLLRNQAIDSEFVQRDAMVLMDIRDRIGRIEFEFLVEKKLGTENKDNLIMWLMDLFPPESTDPSLQQVPEPQAARRDICSGTCCTIGIPRTICTNVTTTTQAVCRCSSAHTGGARF